jgi:hypothetical protein
MPMPDVSRTSPLRMRGSRVVWRTRPWLGMAVPAPAVALAAGTAIFGAATASPAAETARISVRVGAPALAGPLPRGRVVSTPPGIDCPRTCTADFPLGTTVVLRKRAFNAYKPSSWSLGRGGPPCPNAWRCSFVADRDRRVRASFSPASELVASSSGAGTVVLGAHGKLTTCVEIDLQLGEYQYGCLREYRAGTRVTFKAIVDKRVRGARFVRWSDYRCPPRPVCTLTTSAGEQVVLALFEPVFLDVIQGTFGPVDAVPGSRCTFELSRRCRLEFPLNARVTLTRRPGDHGRDFWWGECSELVPGAPPYRRRPTGLTCELTMNMSQRVVAGTTSDVGHANVGESVLFEYSGPPGGRLDIRGLQRGGHGSCRLRCTRSYYHGTEVEVRATSGGGARFERWADIRSRSSVRKFRIGSHNPIKAIFRRG